MTCNKAILSCEHLQETRKASVSPSHRLVMTGMMRVVAVLACLCCVAQAFVPRSLSVHPMRWTSKPALVLVGSSVGGIEGYPLRYGRANCTSKDVLASLHFLAFANETGATANSVPLFESRSEAVVDELQHHVSASAASEEEGPDDAEEEPEDPNESSRDTSLNAAPSDSGIGGSSGTMYNVNRLKRNLVQEMVKDYKKELLDNMGKPSTDFALVEDKLASLVQSNPVSCTTDSNLLDGEWSFAFGSRQSASALMDPNRFDIAARRMAHTQVTHSASVEGLFRSSARTFYLEDLEEDEDAYVLDCTRFLGGLVRKDRRYNVTRLTRTSLKMDLCYQQWWLFGKRTRQQQFQENGDHVDLRILYVDNDLCVSASNDLAVSPFYVYTKNDAWVSRGQRRKRNVRRVLDAMGRVRKSFWSIVTFRKRLWTVLAPPKVADDSTAARILVELDGDSKKLTVLKLGDLERDENAWEGEDDPFVHLSADERQEKLKNMRVRDIHREARRQMNRKAKLGKKKKRKEERKAFKKPE